MSVPYAAAVAANPAPPVAYFTSRLGNTELAMLAAVPDTPS